MSNTVLSIENLVFQWPAPAGFSIVVSDLSVSKGEKVLLLGESGSGKSTLLSLICGTVAPTGGTLSVAGHDMVKSTGAKRDKVRADNIGVIFQQFNLLPFGTVADNILLPLKFAPQRRLQAGNALETAHRLCLDLGLPENVMTVNASALSVGQQQRVAVARALIGAPKLLIADEPTSALDANSRAAFLDVLFEQCKASKASLLMVSHDPSIAADFDRVLNMADISVCERSNP